ncbi:MAG: hypothetical protein J2P45_01100 [Candidatus Dormibacteraeota bacterium]|nr:hypothetical protein [Candidatus Dormibacteraeota bacterium]
MPLRLDPLEVPRLPLPAALLDRAGIPVAQTPEWQGAGAGSLSYHAGAGRLVVGPTETTPPGQEELMGRLLRELGAAAAAMTPEEALRASVLSSSLELVAGVPTDLSGANGDTAQVLEYAQAAITARTSDVNLEVVPEPVSQPVAAPAQIALALVQLAVNAAIHDGATSISLRVDLGPTFWVEWPSERGAPVEAAGHPRQARRSRWGLGYVRIVADALGATALPPGPSGPGRMGACLSLGSRRLTLPLAVYSGWQCARATQTWEQELSGDRERVERTWEAITATIQAAWRNPGPVARHELYAARYTPTGTWIALVPETGPARTHDVLHGLDHERALWNAPEPHAAVVHALITILEWSLGGERKVVAPDAFRRDFQRACSVLGVAFHPLPPLLACPDPRVAAFLLKELGGTLTAEGDGTALRPAPAAQGSPILRLLARPNGTLQLTP